MLTVNVNTVTMATTCTGSHLGFEFLNYKFNRTSISAQLEKFLSKHFKKDGVKIYQKLLQENFTQQEEVKTNNDNSQISEELSEGNFELPWDATKENSQLKGGITEDDTHTAGDITEDDTQTVGDITEDDTQTARDITEDDTQTVGDITQEDTPTAGEIIEDDIQTTRETKTSLRKKRVPKRFQDDMTDCPTKSKRNKCKKEETFIENETNRSGKSKRNKSKVEENSAESKTVIVQPLNISTARTRKKPKRYQDEETDNSLHEDHSSLIEVDDIKTEENEDNDDTTDDERSLDTDLDPAWDEETSVRKSRRKSKSSNEQTELNLSTSKKAKTPAKDLQEKFVCRKCDSIFPTEHTRIQHEVTEHNFYYILKSGNPNQPYKCPVCSQTRTTKSGIEIHVQQHCLLDPAELTCKICKFVCKTKNRLWNHEMTHEEPKFPCDICGKKFTRMKYVRSHKVGVHKVQKLRGKKVELNIADLNPSDETETEVNTQEGCQNDLMESSIDMKPSAIQETEKDNENTSITEKTPDQKTKQKSESMTDFNETEIAWNYEKNPKETLDCRNCDETFTSELSRIHHEVTVHNFYFTLETSNPLKPYRCPICKADRKTKEGMELHIGQHCEADPVELTCKICKLVCTSKNRLWNHELTHNEPRYPCDICGKKFTMIKYVRRHKVEVHKIKREDLDDTFEKFESPNFKEKEKLEPSATGSESSISVLEDQEKEKFEQNDTTSEITTSVLDESNQLDASESPIKEEILVNISSKKTNVTVKPDAWNSSMFGNQNGTSRNCQICRESFETEMNFKLHMKEKHNGIYVSTQTTKESDDNVFPCQQCDVVTFSAYERLQHELKDHDMLVLERFDGMRRKGQVKCPICSVTRKSIESMKIHIQQHFGTDMSELTCDICHTNFKTKNRLKNHMLIHNEAKYPCHICGKKFRMLKYVRRHVQETHNIEPEEREVQRQKQQQKRAKRIFTPGMCDICGKTFHSQYQVTAHKSTHSDARPFSCGTCGKAFRLAKSLRAHMLIHQDKKEIICETCGKRFKLPQGLRMHKLRYHENKRYDCDVCDRNFLSALGKKYHMLKYHKDLVISRGYKLFPCKYCDQILASRQSYLRHESTHIDNRIHRCDICNGRWATVAQLNTHRKIHFGGNKKYQCKVCTFKCYTPWKMKRHLSSAKHIENCRAVGHSASVAKDMLNTDIVEQIAVKSELKTEVKNPDSSLVNEQEVEEELEGQGQGSDEVECPTITDEVECQTITEEENVVEVKYIEIPSTLGEGSQIIYTDGGGGMVYSIVDGDNTYICDQDINQAVESILKLKQV